MRDKSTGIAVAMALLFGVIVLAFAVAGVFATGEVLDFYDDSTHVAQRTGLNLVSGTNTTVTCADAPGNQRVDCTIASTGGGAVADGIPATFVVCASNAENTTSCDYLADGTDDEAQLNAAIAACPANGCAIHVTEGTYNLNLANSMLSFASNMEMTIAAGAHLNATGVASGKYVLNIDGTSTAKSNVRITGEGRITVGNASNGALKISGDVSEFYIGEVQLYHGSPVQSTGSGVYLDGSAGRGIRNGTIKPFIYGFDRSTNDDSTGGVIGQGLISHVTFEPTVRYTNQGIRLWMRDVLPTRAATWNECSLGFSNKAPWFDGDITTTDNASPDADDCFLFAFATQVQGMKVWITASSTATSHLHALTYNGTNWFEQQVRFDETRGTTGTMFQTGELGWAYPRDDQWALATIDGTSAWWVMLFFGAGNEVLPTPADGATPDERVTPMPPNPSVGVNMGTFTIGEVVGFQTPFKNLVRGSYEDLHGTGVQLRGTWEHFVEARVSRADAHGINFNSENTTVLASGQDDRHWKSRWVHDASVVSGTTDTQVVTRSLSGCLLEGTYTNGRAVGWEMDNSNVTEYCVFDGLIDGFDRLGIRMSGRYNTIRGVIGRVGLDTSLAAIERAGVRIINNVETGAPIGNIISATIRDPSPTPYMQYAVYVNSGMTNVNYVVNAAAFTGSTAIIQDDGGALVVRNNPAAQRDFRWYELETASASLNYIGITATSALSSNVNLIFSVTGNCSALGNGGALTINSSNEIVCSDDDGGAGAGGDPVLVNATPVADASGVDFQDGDIDWTLNTGVSPDALTATLACSNCVALTSETTGNYVATITGPAEGLTVSGSGSEGAAVSLALANDLAAFEALTGTGFAFRTGTDAWIATGAISDIGRALTGGTTHLTLPGVAAAAQTTLTIVANSLYHHPVFVFEDVIVDAIVAQVQTLAASTTCRVGIYNANVNLQPTSLVVDAGTFDAGTTGLKAVTVSPAKTLTASQGRYSLVLVCDGGPILRTVRGGYPGTLLDSGFGASAFIQSLRNNSASAEVTALSNPGIGWSTAPTVNTGFEYGVLLRVSTP